MLSIAENYYMEKLEKWEDELRNGRPNKILHLYSDSIDSLLSFIPDMQKQKILRSFDNILFHLHAILFNSTLQRNTAQKLMHHARIHNESIFPLNDMKKLNIDQLQAIADKQMAHYRMNVTKKLFIK
ncbi:EcsC family protein [Niallia sp. JL1B1071]|uniref:EcsC family protein n=1 Tax=Niallia tiangongensis TaxID=3237105 RepID=UPI0037DDB5FF